MEKPENIPRNSRTTVSMQENFGADGALPSKSNDASTSPDAAAPIEKSLKNQRSKITNHQSRP